MEEEENGEGRDMAKGVHPLTQVPVPETADPPQGGREADSGSQVGGRNPGTQEGEGAEGIIPVWEILKGPLLNNDCSIVDNLSRLTMLCNVLHQWPGGAHFPFNCYRHSVKILVRRPGVVDTETPLIREGAT